MKRKLTYLFIIISYSLFAQVQELREYRDIPEEQIVFNINADRWLGYPKEMEIKPYSAGIDLYYMKPIFWRNRNISIAGGTGISVQNIKSNTQFYDSLGYTLFVQIPDSVDYSTNKISTVYIDIPIELRFRTRPIAKKRNIKFVLGFKIGYNIQRYTKYEGDNFHFLNENSQIKYKIYKINNILTYRYGVFVRAGYGKFNLTAYYALTNLFKKDKAPEIIPFSVGLSITLF